MSNSPDGNGPEESVRIVPRPKAVPAAPKSELFPSEPDLAEPDLPEIDLVSVLTADGWPESTTKPSLPTETSRRATIVIDDASPLDESGHSTKDVSLDPRLKARRRQVAKAAGRARFKRGAVFLVLVGVLTALVLFFTSSVFTVKSIEVTGLQYTPTEAVDEALAGVKGSSLWKVDLENVRTILGAEPWVRRVSARRDWPSALIIDIAERRPVASYPGSDGNWRVFDSEGRVLAILADFPVDFPSVVGNQEPVAIGSVLSDDLLAGGRVAQALPPQIKSRLKEIRVSATGSVDVRLTPSGSVLVGSAEGLREKLISAITGLDRCGSGLFESIDVRAAPDIVIAPSTACKTKGSTTPGSTVKP